MDIAQSFMTFMHRGGIVMWPLLLLSVLTVAITAERAIFWTRVHGRNGRHRLARLNRALHGGNTADLAVLVKTDPSPYAELSSRLNDPGGDEARAIADAEEVRPRFDRGLVMLSTIITAAPMLGILGTVVGIIQSFELLGGDASISDPRQVSGGIAEALITTATGLVVALMALFPYMIFRGQQERSIGRMESLIASAMHPSDASTAESNPMENRPLSPPSADHGKENADR